MVRRMVGVERAGEVLSGEELEMSIYWKNLGLSVEVVDGGGRMGAGDEPKTTILDELETTN